MRVADRQGFGFIRDERRRALLYRSAVRNAVFELPEGQRVEFTTEESPKGAAGR
jgi:cold shock CspA family protein